MTYTAAIIGYGYWGPILLRNFNANRNIKVKIVCDRNLDKLDNVVEISPNIRISTDSDDVFCDQSIDIVVIATQATCHYELTRKALLHNKHVFVEKPFTLNSRDAFELVRLNKEKKRLVMVDHTYLFTPQYKSIKNFIKNEKLGNLYHFHSTRADFGLFQKDTSILWHLLYHDIYMLQDLFGIVPIQMIIAAADSHIIDGIYDTLNISIRYESGLSVDIICNMLFPIKERKIVITGDRKILLWDDIIEEKIRIWKKQVGLDPTTGRLTYDVEDSYTRLEYENREALQNEVEYFVSCLHENEVPINNDESGSAVVQFLESVNAAIEDNKKGVKIDEY